MEATQSAVPPSIAPPKQIANLRIGLLTQWYEPEPVTIPAVLARELRRRNHAVRVLTGFPNFPTGRVYDGYRMAWRHDAPVSEVPVRRVPLFASHGTSGFGRALNYVSFALAASALGTGWFKDIEALWVYNSPPTVGVPTWLIKARYRPRVVLHVMDLWPESFNASGFGDSVSRWSVVRRGLDRWLEMTYRVADVVACTSQSQIEILAERGVPRSKLSYVPIWADEAIFNPTPRDDRLATELGVSGKTVLLYAGAIGEPQGLNVLVDACSRLVGEPDFHCLVAGSGVAESRLRAEAARKKLDNITFLGRWPIGDMTRLMSIGDVHLVSLRSDPLAKFAMPSKLPATLACGKPVIVAAFGDAAKVVAESNAGWTCPPGDVDELERSIRAALAAGSATLREMGTRGRAVYKDQFSVEAAVDGLEQLLSAPRNETRSVA